MHFPGTFATSRAPTRLHMPCNFGCNSFLTHSCQQERDPTSDVEPSYTEAVEGTADGTDHIVHVHIDARRCRK